MNSAKKLELIDDLMLQTEYLNYKDSKALDSLVRRGEMVIRNIFGAGNKYLNDLNNITFYPNVSPVDEEYKRKRWESGQHKMLNLFKTMALLHK